nr:hypothetical protein [uncultured Pseudogulbenkiania sp.]
MTTNVFDKSAVTVATDSRWSFRIQGHAICYVDDTGFDKIFVDKSSDFAASFAGNAGLIESWKEWLDTDMSTQSPPVFANGVSISVCIVDKNGDPLFYENQDIHHLDGSLFAGSGSLHAYECWKQNKSATKAVESAKILDCYSGGSVVSVDFPNGKHNVVNNATLKDVSASFLQKGFVMYLNNNATQPVEFKTAAANDPLLQQAAKDLSAGNVQVSAPYDSMYQDWSDDSKAALGEALKKLKARYR